MLDAAPAAPSGAGEPVNRASLFSRAFAALSRNLTTVVIGIVVFTLVVPPLVMVIASSFSADQNTWGTRSLVHYRTVIGDSFGVTAVKNTLVFSAGSALLAVALAALVAFVVERTNAPFRRFVYAVVIISFAVPTIIQSMGWILLLGPTGSLYNQTLDDALGGVLPNVDLYTMKAMIFVQGTILFPAMFLLIVPAFRMLDPALEQAAAISGASRLRVLRAITLPLAMPSILAALLLAFIVTIESFEVPALIGSPGRVFVLSTSIFSRMKGYNPDYGAAAAFACLLMLMTIFGVYLYHRATARASKFATVTGKGYRPDKIDLGRSRWPVGIGMLLVPLLVLAPILILAWTSLLPVYSAPSKEQLSAMTLDNYRRVLGDEPFRESLKTSLWVGVAAALTVMLITLIVAWMVLRRRSAATRGVDQLTTLPLVIPGVVLSLALLRLFLDVPIDIYGTVWVILIAYVIHYMPYGLRYNHAGMVSIHSELEEAAQVSGAGTLRVFARVVVPLMYPALVAGGLFVFLASVRQLSVAVFLVGPNANVVANSMFEMWSIGSFVDAAAGAIVVVLTILVVAAVIYWATGLRKSRALSPFGPS